MNFKRSKIWACSRLLASSFLGLFCAGGFLNLNMTMMVAHAEGRVFDGNCINRTTYDPQTGILTIPPGYTEIKDLRVAGVKIVNIPASITCIGEFAFSGCESLTHVNIEPNSKLKTIGFDAFRECTALEKINLPEGLKEIDEDAFANCTSLTSISIPSNVNTIGQFAFGNCTSLREIFLPNQIGEIANWTFYGCSSLENINIPDCVKRIGMSAFSGCTSLKTIALPKELREIDGEAFYICTSLTSIDIPSNVNTIGSFAFGRCTSLKEISLSKQIKEIDSGTFEECSSLENINIPDCVRRIGMSAFSDCTSLKTIALPKELREIGEFAFSRCSLITDIDMPDTVLEIAACVFSGCTSLKKVHLSENLQKIPYGTFRECSSLENISVPNKVREIEQGTFCRCNSLKELHFPHSLETLDYYAFGGCDSLKLIKIPAHTKIMDTISGGPFDLVIGRDTKIEKFTCDSQHKCDSCPNLSEISADVGKGDETETISSDRDSKTQSNLHFRQFFANLIYPEISNNNHFTRENSNLESFAIPEPRSEEITGAAHSLPVSTPGLRGSNLGFCIGVLLAASNMNSDIFNSPTDIVIGNEPRRGTDLDPLRRLINEGGHNISCNHGLFPVVRPEMPAFFRAARDPWEFLDGHYILKLGNTYHLM